MTGPRQRLAAPSRSRAQRPGGRLPRARDLAARAARRHFTIGRARPTGWSVSRAAASRPRPSPSLRYLPRNGRISSGSVTWPGEDLAGLSEAAAAQAARQQGLHGLPGPRRGAEPDDADRRPGRRGLRDRRRGSEAGARARAGRCCAGSGSPTPTASCAAIRTSSRAACSSGSASPWRWPRSGAADPRRADHRPRRDGGGGGAGPDLGLREDSPDSCSSATTSPWSPRCATASASCTPAGWSRRARSTRCSNEPRHPYTVGLLGCLPRDGGARTSAARHDPGLPAGSAQAAGLRVRRALRIRRGDLPRRSRRSRPRRRAPSRCHSGSRRTSCRARRPPRRRLQAGRPRTREPVIRGEPDKTYRQEGHDTAPSDDVTSRCGRARRSAWSASPAAARRPSRARCWD